MKMNKWTMGLAAAGVVTLSSVAQAQDAAAGAEALAASTTLSGYVSTGYHYGNGQATGGENYFRAADGQNAFSLDVVDLKLSSAQGDGAMATGYTVELWMGPAATDIGTQDSGANVGTVELMQANIDLRWNDIDLKVGQFGTVVGNEVYNYNENAFYTHSWGFAIEPTHHTGLLASYTVSDDLQIAAGLANSTSASINAKGANQSNKTVLASVSYTLPSGTGALAGTELYYGYVSGMGSAGVAAKNDDYHYASAKLPELVANLSIKATWDHVEYGAREADSNVVGLNLSYNLDASTDINVRYEMGNMNTAAAGTAQGLGTGNADNLQSFTVGVNRKIWDNVTSRIEYRSDSVDTTGSVDDQQSVVALNLIYSF